MEVTIIGAGNMRHMAIQEELGTGYGTAPKVIQSS